MESVNKMLSTVARVYGFKFNPKKFMVNENGAFLWNKGCIWRSRLTSESCIMYDAKNKAKSVAVIASDYKL